MSFFKEVKYMSFIMKLLDLQQDGNGAISAPSNWKTPPLLEVQTDLDNIVEILCEEVTTRAGSNKVGRWHFFVGSPGNGKSAIVGKIYRDLKENLDCEFIAQTTEGAILFEDLNPGEIPYLIKVQESSHSFACCWLAQDTSVFLWHMCYCMTPHSLPY